jgi:hypothetical protein
MDEEKKALASARGRITLGRADVQEKIADWRKSKAGVAFHKKHGKDSWAGAPYREFVCEVCGKTFKSRHHMVSRRCGKNCQAAARRRSGLDNITTKCAECGADFVKNKYSKSVNCSRVCAKRAADRTRYGRLQPDRRG